MKTSVCQRNVRLALISEADINEDIGLMKILTCRPKCPVAHSLPCKSNDKSATPVSELKLHPGIVQVFCLLVDLFECVCLVLGWRCNTIPLLMRYFIREG